MDKRKIIVLSGAGISAESGIRTFRDSDGLWETHRIEDVATPQAWKKDPSLVQHFYNLRRKQVMESEPNPAHLFLAKLEETYNVQIVTQNIDDLHERAGSTNVLHLHGNIRLSKSSGPNREKQYYNIEGWELKNGDKCPEGYQLRPHVVWFGEDVPKYSEALLVVRSADVLIVIGTSLNVYPAAGLVEYAPSSAMKIIVDPNADDFTVHRDFIRIASTAVESIEKLEELLLGKNQ